MAWEWELRATCQASVRYAALGDSMLSWSAAEGAPTGAADLGDGRAASVVSQHKFEFSRFMTTNGVYS